MHNVIVPTDFSIKSHNALTLAKRIARKTKGNIHLLNVIEPIVGKYPIMGENLENQLDDIYTIKLVEKVNEELFHLKQAHQSADHNVVIHVKVGDPFREIHRLSQKLDADLVIIGDKGFTDADEFFLGSITDKVVRSAPCPVITVKEVIDDEEFQNIVYATDLEEDHKPMIDLLINFQNLFDAQLHIVKVNTRRNFQNDIDTQVDLKKLADKYELKNYTLSIYNHEDEEYGIVYFADAKKADLIAIGVNERSGFRRLISGGSLANEVTDHTFRPVLTYRFGLD